MKIVKFLLIFLLLLWKIAKDFFEKGYTYHASAVAFSAFLTLNAGVVFLGTVLKYIPNKEKIVKKLYQIFPNISQDVVNFLVQSVENLSVNVQVFTLLLVVFFIGNFLRTLEVAFAHIAGTKPRTIPLMNYFLPFFFGFLMLFYGFTDVVLNIVSNFFSHYKFIYPLWVKVLIPVKLTLDYLAFPVGLLSVYIFISPVRLNFRITLGVSLFLTLLLLNPLKALFSWYATHFFLKNLILTPLAGVLIFLVWIYTISLVLLLGYRFILFLQRG